MSGLSLAVELIAKWLSEYPQTAMLFLIGAGAYYELHHGRIAEMAENQYILGTAVYALLTESDHHDAEEFRKDMWGEDDPNGRPYPGDWDRDRNTAEPPVGRGDD